MFSMSGDGTDDVKIPAVFMFSQDAQKLLKALYINPLMEITIREAGTVTNLETEESMFQKLKVRDCFWGFTLHFFEMFGLGFSAGVFE